MSSTLDRFYRDDVRYLVKEFYFGKFDAEFTRCGCVGLFDCKIIIDALVKSNSGRPLTFKAVKVVDGYSDVHDSLVWKNEITGEVFDFSPYIEGVCALDYKEVV